MNPEREVLEIIKDYSDFLCALPCDRFRNLYALAVEEMPSVEVAREEEGVGICAGASLSGKKPALLIQNSGLGNMINALASLVMFYELPLAIIMSWRGVYREPIEAQKPMGRYTLGLLSALDIPCYRIERGEDIPRLKGALKKAYSESRVVAVLLSPRLWEGSSLSMEPALPPSEFRSQVNISWQGERKHTRYEFMEASRDFLEGKAVVCNLGVPSKELYSLCHQESNFYMLGSMGMALPIALGVALNTSREVVALEGDGSLLMNPSTLATASRYHPANLTVLAMDNGTYGSTGDQPSSSSFNVDLGGVAKSFGWGEVKAYDSPHQLKGEIEGLKGSFVHCLCRPGNARVENIPLQAREIKESFMGFLI